MQGFHELVWYTGFHGANDDADALVSILTANLRVNVIMFHSLAQHYAIIPRPFSDSMNRFEYTGFRVVWLAAPVLLYFTLVRLS